MVAPQGDLVTQRTGQVAGTGDGMAALVVHALIVVFQVLPQLGLFFKSLRRPSIVRNTLEIAIIMDR